MKQFIFIISITWLSVYSNLGHAGNWSSGGGDPLEVYFEEGRLQALDIVSRLSETSLNRKYDDKVTTEIAAWLLKNRSALVTELQAMKFTWTTDSKPKCVWTEYAPLSPVEISFASCRGTVSSKQEAGKVLIHESVHHFGIEDHEFGTKVAIFAYQAWENMLLNEVPFCTEKIVRRNILASRILGSWKYDSEIDSILVGQNPDDKSDYDPSGTFLSFTEDVGAVKLFPGFGKCAYISGWFTASFLKNGKIKTMRSPFVLADLNGNPVIYVDERGDEDGQDFVTDLHALNMMIARGSDLESDILFQGGDNNNQRLYALRRIPVSSK